MTTTSAKLQGTSFLRYSLGKGNQLLFVCLFSLSFYSITVNTDLNILLEAVQQMFKCSNNNNKVKIIIIEMIYCHENN